MNAKHFLPILLVCCITNADTPQPDCAGNVPAQAAVLTAAQQRAADLQKALAACLAAKNCQDCPVVKQAFQDVGTSIGELNNHLNTLNQSPTGTNGGCKTCEQKKTKKFLSGLRDLSEKVIASGVIQKEAQNVIDSGIIQKEAQNVIASGVIQKEASTIFDKITHKK